MRRFGYLALAIAALVAPVSFVGCGSGESTPSPAQTEDAGQNHAGHEHHEHDEHDHNE